MGGAVYVLSPIVDTFGRTKVGRVVYRYTETGDPVADVLLERQFVHPVRKHWLGREVPKMVRFFYDPEFSP